jgi:hypothetical protein
MNERMKKLVLEAGFIHYGEDTGFYNIPVPAFNSRMEKFAELIVFECVKLAVFNGDSATAIAIKEHFGVES